MSSSNKSTANSIAALAVAWRSAELLAKVEESEVCDCGAIRHDPTTVHYCFECACSKRKDRVEEALECLRSAIDAVLKQGATE